MNASHALSWNPTQRLVDGPRGATRLSELEAKLLEVLISASGEPIGRPDLAQQTGLQDERAVDFAIRRIRSKIESDPSEPRLLLTVHGHGYRLGAARIAPPLPPRELLQLSDRRVDVALGIVERFGEEHTLTTQEHAVLRVLVQAAGRSLSRDELRRAVWGSSPPSSPRRVDSLVHQLRKELEAEPSRPVHLLTAPGGYRLRIDLPKTNLGPELTRLLGRDEVISSLPASAEQHLWLQLVGPPGVGKSSLARALGRHLAERLPGGAWWVDCAALCSAEGVLLAISRVLGVEAKLDLRTLTVTLGRRARMALLLDSIEQTTDIEPLLEAMLRAGCLLVGTSTRAIELSVGRTVPLTGLSLDDGEALFRAIAADSGATLRPQDSPSIRTFLESVEGSPLAIDFAARAMRHLAPKDLARGGLSQCNAAMRATIDRAWQIASSEQRRALVSLAAFRTPFTLEAACAVSGASEEMLISLHQASWLVALPWGDSRHFRPYTLVAEYLAERPLAAETQQAHALWFAERARAWEAEIHGPREPLAFSAARDARADFEAAAETLARSDPERGASIYLFLLSARVYPPWGPGLDALLALPVGAFPSRSALWLCHAAAHYSYGDLESASKAHAMAVAEGLDPMNWELRYQQDIVAVTQNQNIEVGPKPTDPRHEPMWHLWRGRDLGSEEGLAAIAWGRQLARRRQNRRAENQAESYELTLLLMKPDVDPEPLARRFEALAQIIEAEGFLYKVSALLMQASLCRARCGHISAARSLAERARDIGADLSLPWLEAMGRSALLRCVVADDDPASVIDLAIRSRVELAALGHPLQGLTYYAQALALLRDGDRAGAIEFAATSAPLCANWMKEALLSLVALLEPERAFELPQLPRWSWMRSVVALARHIRFKEPLGRSVREDCRRDPMVRTLVEFARVGPL